MRVPTRRCRLVKYRLEIGAVVRVFGVGVGRGDDVFDAIVGSHDCAHLDGDVPGTGTSSTSGKMWQWMSIMESDNLEKKLRPIVRDGRGESKSGEIGNRQLVTLNNLGI